MRDQRFSSPEDIVVVFKNHVLEMSPVEWKNKQMMVVHQNILITVMLENDKLSKITVNSDWYTTICLPKTFGDIRKTNKRRQIIVHRGNASSHTSAQISALLTGQNVALMGHPPYSPDLAHNDFSLFPHIKKKLRG